MGHRLALAVFEVGILVKKWGRKFQMPLRDSEMIPKHPHVMLYYLLRGCTIDDYSQNTIADLKIQLLNKIIKQLF